MSIHIVRGESAALVVGGAWNIAFYTTDVNGFLATSSPVVTITKPDGTTDQLDAGEIVVTEITWASLVANFGGWDEVITDTGESVSEEPGRYLFSYQVTAVGRYIAEIAGTEFSTRFISAHALAVTSESEMPVVGDAVAYMGITPDLGVVEELFEAEKAAQRARCSIPAAYPPDLRLALLRRTKRAYEMRQNTTASDSDTPFTGFVPNNDPEVRRYEAPYRKVVLG